LFFSPLLSEPHNGFDGELVIDCVKRSPTNGSIYLVTGSLYGNKMYGSYDQTTREVNLLRLIDPNDPTSFQSFNGYLSHTQGRNVSQFTLTGTVYTYGGQKGGGQDLLRCSWRASITFQLDPVPGTWRKPNRNGVIESEP
jgi:hypothetical protein